MDGTTGTWFAVDIEKFGDPARDDEVRRELHVVLYRELSRAFDASGVPWDGCRHEDRGDGAIVEVPPTVPMALLIDPLLGHLRAALRKHNRLAAPAAQLRLRVALHTGIVYRDAEGWVGSAVNHVSRLLDADVVKKALAASTADLVLVVSDRVYDDVVRNGTGLIDPDTYRPVTVVAKETRARAWVHVPEGPGVRRTDTPAVDTLPGVMPGFAGRDEELARLDAELDAVSGTDEAGLLVVHGMAGIGKTALAVRWAHRVRDGFPDARLFIDMRGHSPGGEPVAVADALGRLLRALGVPAEVIPADPDERAALYRNQLADRRALIIVDNAARVDQVRPLLPGGPACMTIVTSRNRLTGLVAKDGARLVDLETLSLAEAVELLSTILGPERVAAEPQASRALAERCACLPLALRIAAANLLSRPSGTIGEYVAELSDDRLPKLAVADEPGNAVRSAFFLSYKVLSDTERRAFRRLGLLVGTDFSAATCAALLDVSEAEASRALQGLAGAHLVQADGDRYRLHDLLREYARERADEEDPEDERAAATSRMLRVLRTGALRAAGAIAGHRDGPSVRHLDGAPEAAPPPEAGIVEARAVEADTAPSRERALAWLEAERVNLVAATRALAAAGDHAGTVELARALHRFLHLRRYTEADLDTQTHGLAAARATGDAATEAEMLHNRAVILRELGRYPDALDHEEQALAIWRDRADPVAEAASLDNLARVYQRLGRYDEALQHARGGLVLNQEAGNRHGEGNTLDTIAQVLEQRSDYSEALLHAEQALAVRRDIGDRRGQAESLTGIAVIQRNLGRYAEALDHARQALAIERDIGDRHGEADTLDCLARTYRRQDAYAEALGAADAGLALCLEIGDRQGEAGAHITLGRIHHNRSGHSDALGHFTRALEIYQEIGDRRGEGTALGHIGSIYVTLGRYGQARTYIDRSLAIRRDIGDRTGEGESLTHLSHIHRYLGRYDEAVRLGREALALQQRIGDAPGAAETLEHLSRACRRLGRYAESMRYGNLARTRFAGLGDRTGEGRALDALACLFRHMGDRGQAMEYAREALLLQQDIGDRYGEAATHINLAKLYLDEEIYDLAAIHADQAITIETDLGDHYGHADALHTRGTMHLRLGEPDAARRDLIEALMLRSQIGDTRGQARTRDALADLAEREGDKVDARDHIREALALEVPDDRPRRLLTAGQLELHLNGREAARPYLEKAAEAGDPDVAREATRLLRRRFGR